MKSIIAASPALLLAGAMFAAPVSAQTMLQPDMSQPSQATPSQQTAARALPQGSYLNECKEVRMLQDTLTAFCPKGDGTWQTTQLVNADGCPGGVQNAGGDLVCTTPVGIGSTAAPENYATSSGGAYGTMPPPSPGYASVSPPAYPAVPSRIYAAPPYYGYGPYPYPPAANQYISPSATRAAQPPY